MVVDIVQTVLSLLPRVVYMLFTVCQCTLLPNSANTKSLTSTPANSPSSAIVGLVRTYGYFLPKEDITLNAICPHVVRTGISTALWWYDDLEKRGLLTDINNVVAGFEDYMGKSTRSAECFEAGPKGSRVVQFMDYMVSRQRHSLLNHANVCAGRRNEIGLRECNGKKR
jgi:hypothetical protein